MIESVQQLEKVVHALTRKILDMEKEIPKIKKLHYQYKFYQKYKETVGDVTEDVSKNNIKPQTSSSPKDKDTGSEQKVKKGRKLKQRKNS